MTEPQIVNLQLHSNGSGLPFKVALVDDPTDGDTKLVIMFAQPGATAVLSLDRLIAGEDIATTYRGDRYDGLLRETMWEN
jgi:hypothetical protein